VLQPIHVKIRDDVKKLTPEQKLAIYQDFLRSTNKAAVARKYHIDRSYLYDIVKSCDQGLLEHLAQQKAGRKTADQPPTFTAALEKIKSLEDQNLDLEKEKEKWYIKSEFLKLRLSWAEKDKKDRHLKKTKKNKS
jgi:transposase-like protein